MHRVVNMTSVGVDPAGIEGYKEEIRQKLTEYNTYDAQVNDGQNEEGNPTLAVNADFRTVSDANAFHDWLKQYVSDRRDDFVSVRTRVHDCYHAADQNMPCELGDVWELS
jgi:hypothetical protein